MPMVARVLTAIQMIEDREVLLVSLLAPSPSISMSLAKSLSSPSEQSDPAFSCSWNDGACVLDELSESERVSFGMAAMVEV